jgi:hypothetical protein
MSVARLSQVVLGCVLLVIICVATASAEADVSGTLSNEGARTGHIPEEHEPRSVSQLLRQTDAVQLPASDVPNLHLGGSHG